MGTRWRSSGIWSTFFKKSRNSPDVLHPAIITAAPSQCFDGTWAKHREKRLKAKAARREASKRHEQKSDEEDEVVAYLADHSEDEFDPSTLPDPDELHSSSEEDRIKSAKRQHSSEAEGAGGGEEEEGEFTMQKRKKVEQLDDEHRVLNTGLSLAEDEELVLQLLGGRR